MSSLNKREHESAQIKKEEKSSNNTDSHTQSKDID